MNTWWFVWRLIRYAPGLFLVQSLLQIFFLAIRVVPGLIEKAVFDTITGAAPATVGVAALIALYVSIGLARMVAAYGETWAGRTFRFRVGALLRRNLLAAHLRRPGALAPPVSPGEAVNRYRDDVAEVADFPLWLPDVVGNVLSFVLAVMIMARINLPITLFVFLPLVVAFVAGRAAWSCYLAYSHRAGPVSRCRGWLSRRTLRRGAGGQDRRRCRDRSSTHFNALEGAASPRCRAPGHARRDAATRSGASAVTFGVGVMLLLAGQAMTAGTLHRGRLCALCLLPLVHDRSARLSGRFSGRHQAAGCGRRND